VLVCRVEIKIPLVMVDQCWLWHGLVGRSRFATLVFQDGIDTVMYSLLSRVGDELVELVVAWPVWYIGRSGTASIRVKTRVSARA